MEMIDALIKSGLINKINEDTAIETVRKERSSRLYLVLSVTTPKIDENIIPARPLNVITNPILSGVKLCCCRYIPIKGPRPSLTSANAKQSRERDIREYFYP